MDLQQLLQDLIHEKKLLLENQKRIYRLENEIKNHPDYTSIPSLLPTVEFNVAEREIIINQSVIFLGKSFELFYQLYTAYPEGIDYDEYINNRFFESYFPDDEYKKEQHRLNKKIEREKIAVTKKGENLFIKSIRD
jgi:hypothetical protein